MSLNQQYFSHSEVPNSRMSIRLEDVLIEHFKEGCWVEELVAPLPLPRELAQRMKNFFGLSDRDHSKLVIE